MPFQFYCPQGHLLQSDDSQVGQQCMCPYCQSVFLVPEPPRAAPLAFPPSFQQVSAPPAPQDQPRAAPPPGFESPAVRQQAAEPPQFSFTPPTEAPAPAEAPFPGVQEAPFPNIQTEPPAAESPAPEEAPEVPQTAGRELPAVVHILCPSGHELETPREMLDQDALCPVCQVQFLLRYEDSQEYRQEKIEQMRRREEAIARMWIRCAIGAAVLVVIGVIVMIVMAAQM